MRLLIPLFLSFLLSCNSKTRFYSLGERSAVFNGSFSGRQEVEDFVLEGKKSSVDFVIVADTSQSMYHHLRNFGRSLPDLLHVISNYDWQVGITSADHGDHEDPSSLQQDWRDYVSEPYGRFGGLMNLENGSRILNAKILTSKTPNYEQVFLQSLSHDSNRECHRPPYCHPPLEQPLRSLIAAMERALLDNRDLFRPQADLVSLIVANEEERSEDRARATQAKQVVQAFNRIFGHLDKKFIVFNILIMDEACLAAERQKTEVASIAHSIAELAELTGGDNMSICHPNYGQALRGLSKHIKNSLENSILLKKEPVPGTVEVKFVKGSQLKWEQYGRNIIFKNRGTRLVHVSVSYQSLN